MKKSHFINSAKEMFPNADVLTKKQLVQVANKLGNKFAPAWITKNRGGYGFSEMAEFLISQQRL